MPASLVWFIIPLRSKASSRDWDRVCRDLRGTLRSILNQWDGRFRVVLSCSEAPDLAGIDDDRIEIVTGDYPRPTDFHGYAMDKREKKRRAAAQIRAAGGGYVMLVDADDFVSRDLVGYVLDDDNGVGYYVDDGYILYSSTRHLKRTGQIYKICGTCYVCHFTAAELPRAGDPDPTPFDAFTNHRLARETAAEQGKRLAALPFPAVVYQLETGENLSGVHPDMQRKGRYWLRRQAQRIARAIAGRRSIPAPVALGFALG